MYDKVVKVSGDGVFASIVKKLIELDENLII